MASYFDQYPTPLMSPVDTANTPVAQALVNPYEAKITIDPNPPVPKDSILQQLFNPSSYGSYQPINPALSGVANIQFNNPIGTNAAIGQALASFGQGLAGGLAQNQQNLSKYTIDLESQQKKNIADMEKAKLKEKSDRWKALVDLGYQPQLVKEAIDTGDYSGIGQPTAKSPTGYQYGNSPGGVFDKATGKIVSPYVRPMTPKGFDLKVLDDGSTVLINKTTGVITPYTPTGTNISQNGEPVAQTLENMPNVKLNEGQAKNVAYFQQSLPAHQTLLQLESDPSVFDPTSAENRILLAQSLDTDKKGKPSVIAAGATALLSPEGKKYVAAMRQFAENFGRKQSGGAIGGAELNNFLAQTMPTYGDSPEIIKNKQAYRESILKGYQDASGPATKYVKGTKEEVEQNVPIGYTPRYGKNGEIIGYTPPQTVQPSNVWDYDPADGQLKPTSQFIER